MIDRVVCRIGVALAAASVLVVAPLAHAQRGEGSARETFTAAKQEGGGGQGAEESRREPLYLGLDFTLGFGNYYFANQQDPLPPALYPSWIHDTTQVRTATFMLIGHYKFKNFGIGLRMPLVSGHIASDPAVHVTAQDLFNPGNLELSADMAKKISPDMKLVPSIALTLPTSPGSATPYTDQVIAREMAAKATPQDQQTLGDAYARYAVGLAAAFARGGEDDALFFNWRLGVTPKAELKMKWGHTHLEPYVKLPIMFGLEQDSTAEEPVRIEVVGGVRFLQELGPVHLGVRVVGMIPIAARTTLKTPMLSAWPEIRLQITPSAQFWVSGMIPLAGDFNIFDDGKNGSFNAGISATF